MTIKRTLVAGLVALTAAVSLAGVASADPRQDANHPRQEQVLDRSAHQRHLIRKERREGELSRFREHRLLHRVNRVAREDRRFSRVNGGYITKGEQHRLNRQETRTRGVIPG